MVVACVPASSIDLLFVLIDAETHLKKALIVALSAVSNCTTFSVICFNVLVLAPWPAAQATTIPHFRFLNSFNPCARLSVGSPSVIMNTRGRQSPLTSEVVLVTSESIFCDRSLNAPPNAVQPLASMFGCWNAASSVSGVTCCAELLNDMILMYAVSRAYGSLRNVEISVCTPFFTASIGSPYIEPLVSRSRYTGSLLILFYLCYKSYFE